MRSHRIHAFSLIELLVVVAIIGLVAMFAIPATQSVLRGSALDSSSSLLLEQMSLARQEAISRNRTIEARFYRYGDPEMPGEKVDSPETGNFRTIQLFERTENGIWVPLEKAARLPDQIVMSAGERLSTILGEDYAKRVITRSAAQADSINNPDLPRVGKNYEYIAFRFLPHGGTDLPALGNPGKNSQGGLWHITLHATNDIPRTNPPAFDKAPPNYVTWMVDPTTGIGRVYRPGL